MKGLIDEKRYNENVRAKALIQKLGFIQNAVLPQANFIGRVCDIAYYSMILDVELQYFILQKGES